ncbi:MAG: ABC transporter permease [Oscillospiraceae bacterium]
MQRALFIGLTVAVVVVLGVVLSFPRFTSGGQDGADGVNDAAEKQTLAVYAAGGNAADATEFLNQSLGQTYRFEAQADESAARQKVEDGSCQGAVLLDSPLSYRFVVKDQKLFDATTSVLDDVLLTKYRIDAMQAQGFRRRKQPRFPRRSCTGEISKPAATRPRAFSYPYPDLCAVYGHCALWTAGGTERGEREEFPCDGAADYPAKPTNLMFGKVLGAGLAGLVQFTLMFGSGFVFYNQPLYWRRAIIQSVFDMPLQILLRRAVFVLGFHLRYGALGSLANRAEDINTLVLPVTFLFIFAFFAVMFSLGSGNVETPLMIACSYIPFTSPMAMFTRIAMSSVPVWEIAVSVIILLLTTAGLGVLAARIYRAGVLMYGKPPKLSQIFGLMKKSN